MNKTTKDKTECPLCGHSHCVGRLKANNSKRYFCWDCGLEFIYTKDNKIKCLVSDEQGKISETFFLEKDESV